MVGVVKKKTVFKLEGLNRTIGYLDTSNAVAVMREAIEGVLLIKRTQEAVKALQKFSTKKNFFFLLLKNYLRKFSLFYGIVINYSKQVDIFQTNKREGLASFFEMIFF